MIDRLILPRWPRWAGLFLLFTLLWFGNLGDRALLQPDEGRYAEIAREMAQSGDWVTPRLNDLKYFEKPPLQYWMTAAAFRLFGEHEWTARWWPAVTGFSLVVFMFWAASRLYDVPTGLAAAAALGGCSWFLFNAHFNNLDTGLTVFLTVALLGFLLAQRPAITPAASRQWMILVWIALALAVLSKGVVGLVLPGMVLVAYVLIQRDGRLLTRLHWRTGGVWFLLVAAPWFIAVAWIHEEFAWFFFIHEHVQRFLTTTHYRVGAWWYFIPILLIGALPWTPFIAVSLRSGWFRREECHLSPPDLGQGKPQSLHVQRLLLIWTACIFLFFSASQSKLPSYLLPVFPALALFAGVEMQRMKPTTLSYCAWGIAFFGGILLALGILAADPLARSQAHPSRPLEMVRTVIPWVQGSVALFTLSALVAAGLFRRHWRTTGIVTLALGMLSAGVLIMYGHDELSPLYSTAHIVRASEMQHGPFDPTAPFYSIHRYDQTLPFYLKRPITLVQYVDEFALGLAAEPHKALPTVEDWLPIWQNLERGYAIMSPERYHSLAAFGVPMRVLARDPRRVLVSRQ